MATAVLHRSACCGWCAAWGQAAAGSCGCHAAAAAAAAASSAAGRQAVLTSCPARGCKSRGWLRGHGCGASSAGDGRREAGGQTEGQHGCSQGVPGTAGCAAALLLSLQLPAGRRSHWSLAEASTRPAASRGAAPVTAAAREGGAGGKAAAIGASAVRAPCCCYSPTVSREVSEAPTFRPSRGVGEFLAKLLHVGAGVDIRLRSCELPQHLDITH